MLQANTSHTTLYRPPQEGFHYALGVDVADGLEGGDASVIQVGCVETGEHCLEAGGQINPYDLAEMAMMIGYYFNGALIGMENNRDYTPNIIMQEQGYPNIHRQERFIERGTPEPTLKLGWNTGTFTRMKMIADGKDRLKSGEVEVLSPYVLAEMETFALHNGKFQALPGAHDDYLMAWLIMVQMLEAMQRRIFSESTGHDPLVEGGRLTADGWQRIEGEGGEEETREQRITQQLLERRAPELSEPTTTMGNLI